MVDPIEIVDKALWASKIIYNVVKSIKDAPVELKALDREVSRVVPVLEHLFGTLGRRAEEEDRIRDVTALHGLCDDARELVEKANGLLLMNKDGTYKLQKKDWAKWIVKTSNREELTKKFQKLNASIDMYLSYDGHLELGRLRAKVDDQHEVVACQMSSQYDLLQDMRDELRYLVALSMQRAARDQRLGVNQQYDEVTVDGNNMTDIRVSGPTKAQLTSPPLGSSGCPLDCACQCHGRPTSLVSSYLRPIMGSLFVASKRCNDGRCKRHRSNLLQIRYCCPTWFAEIDANIRLSCLPIHFCIQTPRVVQKLDWLHSATLEEVRQKLWSRELTVNDVEPDGESALHGVAARLALDQSEAALSIVALLMEHSAPTEWMYNNQTPVEHALWWSLVHWRRYGSLKAAFDALQFRLGPYLRLDIEEAWEELATKLRWTNIHRRICALPSHSSSPDLSSLPQELASQFNTRDALGRTPLFYAMSTSPAALVALLHAGANPRIDRTILAWAAEAGADTTINILVRAGVYINASDLSGKTALHWAALPDIRWLVNGLSVVLELVRHAGHLLNWVAQDPYGNTPLDYAQWMAEENPSDTDSRRILELHHTRRLPDGAQYLLAPRIVDAEDEPAEDDEIGLPMTSLIRAALRGDIDAIGDLIEQGAMVNERDQEGRTLLHLVALGRVPNGHRVALELVRHGGWGVDWNARTSEDQTALEIAEGRLEQEELSDAEREEAKKIRDLLEAERLPEGEEYLWPCMDPDFHPPPVPGSWKYQHGCSMRSRTHSQLLPRQVIGSWLSYLFQNSLGQRFALQYSNWTRICKHLECIMSCNRSPYNYYRRISLTALCPRYMTLRLVLLSVVRDTSLCARCQKYCRCPPRILAAPYGLRNVFRDEPLCRHVACAEACRSSAGVD